MKRFFGKLTRKHWIGFFIASAAISLMGYGIKYLVSENEKKKKSEAVVSETYPY